MNKSMVVRLVALTVAGCPLVTRVAVSPAWSAEESSAPVIRLVPQLLPEYKARVLSQDYRSAVGRLQDAIEFPRVARDYCIGAQSRSRTTVAEQYDAWEKRNAVFLTRAGEQVRLAGKRLRDEGVQLPNTGAGIMRMLKASADAFYFCRAYADLLSRREELLGPELQRVLEDVAATEAELSKLRREQ